MKPSPSYAHRPLCGDKIPQTILGDAKYIRHILHLSIMAGLISLMVRDPGISCETNTPLSIKAAVQPYATLSFEKSLACRLTYDLSFTAKFAVMHSSRYIMAQGCNYSVTPASRCLRALS